MQYRNSTFLPFRLRPPLGSDRSGSQEQCPSIEYMQEPPNDGISSLHLENLLRDLQLKKKALVTASKIIQMLTEDNKNLIDELKVKKQSELRLIKMLKQCQQRQQQLLQRMGKVKQNKQRASGDIDTVQRFQSPRDESQNGMVKLATSNKELHHSQSVKKQEGSGRKPQSTAEGQKCYSSNKPQSSLRLLAAHLQFEAAVDWESNQLDDYIKSQGQMYDKINQKIYSRQEEIQQILSIAKKPPNRKKHEACESSLLSKYESLLLSYRQYIEKLKSCLYQCINFLSSRDKVAEPQGCTDSALLFQLIKKQILQIFLERMGHYRKAMRQMIEFGEQLKRDNEELREDNRQLRSIADGLVDNIRGQCTSNSYQNDSPFG